MMVEPLGALGEDLRAIYTAMACGVAVYDAGNAIIYANDAAQRILGVSGDQILGRTSLDARWQAVYADGSRFPGTEHPARVALRTGQAQHGVTIGVSRPDGERMWLQVDAVPTRGPAGEVRQVVTSFIDISARHHLEETLRASEARYRAMVDSSGDLIMVVDTHGIARYVSRASHRVLGVDAPLAEGKSIFDFIHPDDVPRALAAFNLSDTAGDSIAYAELRFRHADGSWHTFEIVRNALVDDPSLQGLVIAARDITARRRAEQAAAHLAAIVETSDDAIISMNLAGVVESWNAGAAKLYGRSSEETIGEHISDVAPSDWFEDISHQLDQLAQGARIVHDDPVRITNEGTPIDVSLSLAAIRDASGRITGASIIARDVTVQVQARLKAEELARLQADFVASVSHELRSPLAAVLGYAEVLQAWWAKLTDLKRLEYIDRIVTAARRQKQLIEDVLLVSQMESGTIKPSHQSVVLSTLVERAVEETHRSYHNQPITLDGSEELMVLADARRVTQIMAKLLDNAAKYSPEGRPIQVSWQREGERVVVRVRDTGPGIATECRPVLFTRFGRVPGSPIRAGHVGTGLGLFLARRLAEQMRGRLDLEDSGPGGSTFRLDLPALPAIGEKGAAHARRSSHAPGHN